MEVTPVHGTKRSPGMDDRPLPRNSHSITSGFEIGPNSMNCRYHLFPDIALARVSERFAPTEARSTVDPSQCKQQYNVS